MQEPQTRHPLFRIARRTPEKGMTDYGHYFRISVAVVVIGVLLMGRAIPSNITLFMILALVFSPILLMFFNGTALGLFWSVEIAMTTRRWIRNHDADLWQTIPEGALSVAWQAVIGRLYRDDTFSTSHRVVQGLLIGICFVMLVGLLFVVGSVLEYGRASDVGDILMTNLPVICVGFVLYFDHIQSVMLGCVIGMFNARTRNTTMEMVVRAGTMFGITKALLFLFIVVVYSALQDFMVARLGNPLGYAVSYLLLPVVYLGIHELTLRSAYHFAREAYEGA
jgi:hypothetical protein